MRIFGELAWLVQGLAKLVGRDVIVGEFDFCQENPFDEVVG